MYSQSKRSRLRCRFERRRYEENDDRGSVGRNGHLGGRRNCGETSEERDGGRICIGFSVCVYEGIGKADQPRLCGGVRERRIATGDIDERGSDLLAARFSNAGERAECEAAGVRGESRESDGQVV